MNTIIFRNVELHELKTLRDITIQTFKATYESKNDPLHFQNYLNQSFSIENLKNELLNPNMHWIFVEKDATVIGYLKLNENEAQTEKRPNNEMEIERIYLTKIMQGQGIGRKMIEKSIEIARDKAKVKIWLGVWEENQDAIHFYKKMGFVSFETHAFYMGDERQIDYLMALDLK